MSAAALASGEGTHEAARWGISFALVCALHLAAAAFLLDARIILPPAEVPQPDAVLIDLDPVASPSVAAPTPPPPPSEPQLRQDVPPSPVKAEVTLPRPPPPLPAPPRPEKIAEPTPQPQPSQVAALPKPEAAPAPQAKTASTPANPERTWEVQVLERLEKFKRYPRRAQLRQQQGVVYLRFKIGRRGEVLSHELARPSGIDLLDEEAMTLVDRAGPFPPPPPELGKDSIELVVPVRFILR